MAGLNPADLEKAVKMLRRIRESGVSILLIEHMMQATMALSDRIIVINEGKVLVSGAPKDVVENPAVIEAYLGKERSEEHTSELQSLMRNSYAVICLKKKKDRK